MHVFWWNFIWNSNTKVFIQENACKNVLCKTTAISYRLQCDIWVNYSMSREICPPFCSLCVCYTLLVIWLDLFTHTHQGWLKSYYTRLPVKWPWRVWVKTTWALFQYPIRRPIVRSREVSKPRDLWLKLSDRSEIWQALRQHCCRGACQISKRYDKSNYQSRGFETSRDLTGEILCTTLYLYEERILTVNKDLYLLVMKPITSHRCVSARNP